MDSLRVYVDTSVFGGAFDAQFAEDSSAFFCLVRQGRVIVLVSDASRREIQLAPAPVRELFDELIDSVELIEVNTEVLALRDVYIQAGIVGAR